MYESDKDNNNNNNNENDDQDVSEYPDGDTFRILIVTDTIFNFIFNKKK